MGGRLLQRLRGEKMMRATSGASGNHPRLRKQWFQGGLQRLLGQRCFRYQRLQADAGDTSPHYAQPQLLLPRGSIDLFEPGKSRCFSQSWQRVRVQNAAPADGQGWRSLAKHKPVARYEQQRLDEL